MDTQRFSIKETDEEAPIWLAILTLHYLNNADGRQPTSRLKHFREFKDGHFYEPAFNRRTKEILIQVFGKDPAPMIAAARKLKGKVLETGDASVTNSPTFLAFPSLASCGKEMMSFLQKPLSCSMRPRICSSVRKIWPWQDKWLCWNC